MKLSLVILVFCGVYGASADYDPMQYADRECGQDLSNLWLDVVAVVDNSIGMTSDGMQSVAANIYSLFAAGTRIGSNYADPRSTRVGLVTYNSVANVNADLNEFKSIDDLADGVFTALSDTSDTETSYLVNGLVAAESMLFQQSFNTPRDHFRKVVIVYASAYKDYGDLDPVPVAHRLKTKGVYLVTVAYNQDGDGELLNKLQLIATPGFNFSNTDNTGGNLIGKVQGAMLQSNCFCPNDWKQYRDDYNDDYSFKYGSCLQPITLPSIWVGAQRSCRNRHNNTFLATEFNEKKHDFILHAMRNATGNSPNPISYHIGLNSVAGKWVWDQPVGWPQPQLQSWFNWIPGYPKVASNQMAAQNFQYLDGTAWQNIAGQSVGAAYICETYSCDTDIYCTSNQEL